MLALPQLQVHGGVRKLSLGRQTVEEACLADRRKRRRRAPCPTLVPYAPHLSNARCLTPCGILRRSKHHRPGGRRAGAPLPRSYYVRVTTMLKGMASRARTRKNTQP